MVAAVDDCCYLWLLLVLLLLFALLFALHERKLLSFFIVTDIFAIGVAAALVCVLIHLRMIVFPVQLQLAVMTCYDNSNTDGKSAGSNTKKNCYGR